MQDHEVKVLSNGCLGGPLYLMRLHAPKLANQIRPGQFVHMSVPTLQAHILRRPFSIYDVNIEEGTIDVLYQIVGDGTQNMSMWLPGYRTSMIGPIGTTWTPPLDCKRALLVGGGVGAAPLLLLCRVLLDAGVEVDVILGAATKESLVCKERYDSVGPGCVLCTTDDGSFGTPGFATIELEHALDQAKADGITYDYAAICGPEPLMKGASAMTMNAGIPTQVSMERRMACGVGACLSCVVDTVDGRKRACVDGPIFDAQKVVW